MKSYSLAATGYCMTDEILLVRKLPDFFMTLEKESIVNGLPEFVPPIKNTNIIKRKIRPGGAEANVLRTARNIEKYFFGIVGTDIIGSQFIDTIRKSGMDYDIRIAKGRSPRMYHFIWSDGKTIKFKEKSDYSDLLNQFEMSAHIRKRIEDCDGFYSSNFLYNTPMEKYLLEIYENARSRGQQLFWNFGDCSKIKKTKKKLEKLLEEFRPNILFMNNRECAAMIGTNNTAEGTRWLSKLSSLVVVTSSTGVWISQKNQKNHYFPVKTIKANNTIGAGDHFAGTFLTEFIHKGDIKEAAEFAITDTYNYITQV